MLQDYHRQTTIKLFAPIFQDRSLKRWDSDYSLRTNLSLLSISNSSKNSDDDDEKALYNPDHDRDTDSSSSEEGSHPLSNDSEEEHRTNHVGLDPYILNKHVNEISSMVSNLVDGDTDKSVDKLFDENKSSYLWENDEFNPRLIRPPPFSEHVAKVRESRTLIKPLQRRSARIPVRTTKTEQLKLARQQSTRETISSPSHARPSTNASQSRFTAHLSARRPTQSSIDRMTRSRPNSITSFRKTESARSCKIALDSNGPLTLSPMLIKQMREDIQSNRVPAYYKPLNSALLREHPHPPCTRQYKMKRVIHWLDNLLPQDYIEYNEYASKESTVGTNFNDKLDDEYDLLSDEKRPDNIERTYGEAHHALPLFQAEIYRKMRHHNLLLNRLELDLYVL